MKKLHFILTGIIAILISCNCKEDDTSSCSGFQPVNAEFVFEQGVGFNDDRRYFESDTLTAGSIRFRALHFMDSYSWTIGGDPRVFDTKEIELDFDLDLEGTSIDVTLNGSWTPNLDCFPQDTGEGTLSKSFYIISAEDRPFIGDFKGTVESNPQDTFTINIIRQSEILSTYINNLPNGCERDSQFSNTYITGTYRDFFMPDDIDYPECPVPKGWGHIEDNLKDLTIEYEIWNPLTQQKMNDKFIGTKIQ